MMMLKCLLAFGLLVAPVTLPAPAQASGSFQLAAGSGSGLSAAQIRKLRSSGIPLIVPGYVPPGYFVSKVKVARGPAMPLYEITYKKSSGESFTMTGNDYGLSPPTESDMSMPIPNPVFGSILLDRYGPNDQNRSDYLVEVNYKNRIYNCTSYGGNGSRRVSGPDMIQIIKHLRLI
jgi:hypothetical protein